MKTILFISTYVPNPRLGGVERVTDLLAKEMAARGFKVLYLALRKRKADQHSYDYPAPLFYFPVKSPWAKENFQFYHDFILEHKVDIIINQSALHQSRCKLFLGHGVPHVKTISTIHNLPLLERGMMIGKSVAFNDASLFNRISSRVLYWGMKLMQPYYLAKRKRHYRFLYENGNAICLLSNEYIDDMCNTCGVPRDKVFSISNPCSFKVPPCSLDSKKKQLLFVGRFSSTQKRPELLLDIWSRLYRDYPEWELVYVGDGRGRKDLEQRAALLERVRFVGFQHPEPYYREASIFCMTSPYEGLPMVLIEAQSYGTVPIAFQSFASVTDIVEDGVDGCLVKPFDINEYVERLSTLMKNNDLRMEMSRNATQSVQKFNVSKIVDQWVEQFNRLSD